MKRLILIFTVLLLLTGTQVAQDDPQQAKRVYPVNLPIDISSTVGGNYIDSYVVHLKKGQELHLQFDNQTEHAKVYLDTVLAGTETRFGRDSSENSWSGVATRTGDYEIRLIAFPAARYRLQAYITGDTSVPTPARYDRRRRGTESAHRPARRTR